MKIKSTLVIAMLTLFTIQIFTPKPSQAAEKAPKFWISNLNGKQFKSKKQKQPTVISFFFVDCVPCKREIPQLHELFTTEYPKINLLFMDPLAEDSSENIKTFAKSLNVPTKYFYHDALGNIAKKFKIKNVFPTIVGVKDRQIVFRLNDLSDESLQRIKKHLK